jgi:hypothetical protein
MRSTRQFYTSYQIVFLQNSGMADQVTHVGVFITVSIVGAENLLPWTGIGMLNRDSRSSTRANT